MVAVLVGVASGAAPAAPVSVASEDDAVPGAQGDAGTGGRGDVTRQTTGAVPGKLLDRSTKQEPSTGDKNLDLLLDARRLDVDSDKSMVGKSVVGSASGGSLVRPSGQSAMPLPQAGLLGEVDTSQSVTAAQRAKAARDWLAGSGAAAQAGGRSVDGDHGAGDELGVRARGDAGREGRFRLLPREVIEFLREYRYWILAGGALAALVAWAASAYSRRPT